MQNSPNIYLLPEEYSGFSRTTGSHSANPKDQGMAIGHPKDQKNNTLEDWWSFVGSVLFGRKIDLSPNALRQIAKIQEFAFLQEGWDGYGAAQPEQSAIHKSIKLIREMDRMGAAIFFVAPGPSGEILVELKQNSKTIEFHVYGAKEVDIYCFVGDDCVLEGDLTSSILTDHLAWLRSTDSKHA